MDKKVAQIKMLQDEKDRRKKIEDEAICLIEQGRTEEACELLQTLDDHIAEALMEEVDCVAETAEKACTFCLWVYGPKDCTIGRFHIPASMNVFRSNQRTAGISRVNQNTAELIRITQRGADMRL